MQEPLPHGLGRALRRPGLRASRWLVPLAVALPLALTLGAGWMSWQQAWRDAARDTAQAAEVAAEYTRRVLDGFVLRIERANDLLAGLSDDEIRARERELHAALRDAAAAGPRVEGHREPYVYVYDRDSVGLVSGLVFPVPSGVSFAHREFNQALRGPSAPEVSVSPVYVGAVSGEPFFAVTRRRQRTGNGLAPGEYDGVINVSVFVAEMEAELRRLLHDRANDTIALVRTDGFVLARTVPASPGARLAPGSPMLAVMARGEPRGAGAARSSVDAVVRTAAYRRIEGYPLYIAATRPRGAVLRAWAATASPLLAAGFAACVVLGALALAVRRQQAELASANAGLEERVARRTAELQEREARQAFWAELAERIRPAEGEAAVLAAASEALGRHLRADVVGLAKFDEDSAVATIEEGWVAAGAVGARGLHRLAARGSALEAELRAGRIVVVPDTLDDPRTREAAGTAPAFPYRAVLQVPLLRGTRLRSAFFVLSQAPRDWAAAEIALVEEAADRTRAALERARAEAELRDSETRLRLATDAAEVGFWDVDLVNNTRIWSPRVKAMYGISADAPVSMADFHDGLHPDDRDAAVAASAAASDPARRSLYDVEYRTIGKEDGVVRWVASKGRGIFDDSGRCLRVIGVAVDITARRETEAALALSRAELQRLNESLESRVQQEIAAREAAQMQLAHAQRMEALGQLAGGIAHDINNVLQAVSGGAALIERRPGDPAAVRRMARMVGEAAERGSSVTRRLLAFSRRGDLRSEAVDPDALLADIRDILVHTLGAGVGVRVEAEPDLPALLADKGQLETVLLNLATNARDAMDGRGVIVFSAALEEHPRPGDAPPLSPLEPGAYVRLVVADTGPGMPPGVLARATEPFFTTKPHGKGTGLGLATARGFAEQSGGGLLVESEPGQGARVSIWLPVAEGAPGTDAPTPRGSAAPPEAHRILLVDDEALVRRITAEGLEAAGFSVLAAPGAAAALELLDGGESVDLLVSDLSMPDMDGLALIREAQRRRPRLPAILLTGFATDAAELAISGAVAGTFSLLRKPVTTAALAERISVLLVGAEQERVR